MIEDITKLILEYSTNPKYTLKNWVKLTNTDLVDNCYYLCENIRSIDWVIKNFSKLINHDITNQWDPTNANGYTILSKLPKNKLKTLVSTTKNKLLIDTYDAHPALWDLTDPILIQIIMGQIENSTITPSNTMEILQNPTGKILFGKLKETYGDWPQHLYNVLHKQPYENLHDGWETPVANQYISLNDILKAINSNPGAIEHVISSNYSVCNLLDNPSACAISIIKNNLDKIYWEQVINKTNPSEELVELFIEHVINHDFWNISPIPSYPFNGIIKEHFPGIFNIPYGPECNTYPRYLNDFLRYILGNPTKPARDLIIKLFNFVSTSDKAILLWYKQIYMNPSREIINLIAQYKHLIDTRDIYPLIILGTDNSNPFAYEIFKSIAVGTNNKKLIEFAMNDPKILSHGKSIVLKYPGIFEQIPRPVNKILKYLN